MGAADERHPDPSLQRPLVPPRLSGPVRQHLIAAPPAASQPACPYSVNTSTRVDSDNMELSAIAFVIGSAGECQAACDARSDCAAFMLTPGPPDRCALVNASFTSAASTHAPHTLFVRIDGSCVRSSQGLELLHRKWEGRLVEANLPDVCPWARTAGLAYEGTVIAELQNSFIFPCAQECSRNASCVAFSKTTVVGK